MPELTHAAVALRAALKAQPAGLRLSVIRPEYALPLLGRKPLRQDEQRKPRTVAARK